MPRLYYAAIEQLEHLERHIGPWIVRACEANGWWSPEEVASGLLSGNMQLWYVFDDDAGECKGVIVTQIAINRAGEKIGRDVLMAAENLPAYVRFLPEIETWFARNGCKRVQWQTRKGLARKLPDYRVRQVILEKVVADVLGQ